MTRSANASRLALVSLYFFTLIGCGNNSTPPAPAASSPQAPTPVPKHEATPPVVSMAPATTAGTTATKPSDVTPIKGPATVPAINAPSTRPGMAINPPEDNRFATFLGIKAPKPATWLWQPPTVQFHVAEYIVPGKDGTDQAKINVITAGGTLEQNVARWKQMFRTADLKPVEPKIEEFEADGMKVSLVEFAGEYRGMGAPTFTPDQLFLAAIVQGPSQPFVIRFVGPKATVEDNREEFVDMLHLMKRTEPEK